MMPFRTIEVSDPRFSCEGLRQVTVKSAALRGRADMTLWAPAHSSAGRLPLVILLHGVYGSHWAWTLSGGAHRTAQRLMDAGEIPPLALAMPSDGLWGDGSGYLRQTARHRGGDFERWIVEEVPAAVTHVLPGTTGAPRFLAGLSMGGFGALRLGAKYGDRFRAISGHSSITHFDQLSQFVEEPLSSYGALPEDQSVLQTILTHREQLPPLRFDCGSEDPLLAANRELHTLLTQHNIAHRYEEFPGGHEWPYWEAHLADTLRFFTTQLGPK